MTGLAERLQQLLDQQATWQHIIVPRVDLKEAIEALESVDPEPDIA